MGLDMQVTGPASAADRAGGSGGSRATLRVRAEPMRLFHLSWQGAMPAEERARQEFAELLLRREIAALRPPSLPAALACAARLTPQMVVLWHSRRDLQALYDLATVAGYYGMIAWFVGHGRREYPVLQSGLLGALPTLAAGWPGNRDDTPLTQFGCALWLSRPDLQEHFPITAEAGRVDFAAWFLKKGIVESAAWPVLSQVQADWLTQLESPVAGDPVPVARFLLAVWTARQDLQAHFAPADGEWGARLWTWFLEYGAAELGVHPDLVVRSARALERSGVRIDWV